MYLEPLHIYVFKQGLETLALSPAITVLGRKQMNIAPSSTDLNLIDYHRRREAEECKLAASARDARARKLHFEMAEQHAAIVMSSGMHR